MKAKPVPLARRFTICDRSRFVMITDPEAIVATLRAHMLEPDKQESGFVPLIRTRKNVALNDLQAPHPGGHIIEGGRICAANTTENDATFQISIDGRWAASLSVHDIVEVGLLQGKRTLIAREWPILTSKAA